MNTGLILVALMLSDGTEISCQTDSLITFLPPTSQEVIIEDCGGQRLQCRPQEIVVYSPSDRILDLGMCIDIIFEDSFERRMI